jgi:hypothetical protein
MPMMTSGNYCGCRLGTNRQAFISAGGESGVSKLLNAPTRYTVERHNYYTSSTDISLVEPN